MDSTYSRQLSSAYSREGDDHDDDDYDDGAMSCAVAGR